MGILRLSAGLANNLPLRHEHFDLPKLPEYLFEVVSLL